MFVFVVGGGGGGCVTFVDVVIVALVAVVAVAVVVVCVNVCLFGGGTGAMLSEIAFSLALSLSSGPLPSSDSVVRLCLFLSVAGEVDPSNSHRN